MITCSEVNSTYNVLENFRKKTQKRIKNNRNFKSKKTSKVFKTFAREDKFLDINEIEETDNLKNTKSNFNRLFGFMHGLAGGFKSNNIVNVCYTEIELFKNEKVDEFTSDVIDYETIDKNLKEEYIKYAKENIQNEKLKKAFDVLNKILFYTNKSFKILCNLRSIAVSIAIIIFNPVKAPDEIIKIVNQISDGVNTINQKNDLEEIAKKEVIVKEKNKTLEKIKEMWNNSLLIKYLSKKKKQFLEDNKAELSVFTSEQFDSTEEFDAFKKIIVSDIKDFATTINEAAMKSLLKSKEQILNAKEKFKDNKLMENFQINTLIQVAQDIIEFFIKVNTGMKNNFDYIEKILDCLTSIVKNGISSVQNLINTISKIIAFINGIIILCNNPHTLTAGIIIIVDFVIGLGCQFDEFIRGAKAIHYGIAYNNSYAFFLGIGIMISAIGKAKTLSDIIDLIASKPNWDKVLQGNALKVSETVKKIGLNNK